MFAVAAFLFLCFQKRNKKWTNHLSTKNFVRLSTMWLCVRLMSEILVESFMRVHRQCGSLYYRRLEKSTATAINKTLVQRSERDLSVQRMEEKRRILIDSHFFQTRNGPRCENCRQARLAAARTDHTASDRGHDKGALFVPMVICHTLNWDHCRVTVNEMHRKRTSIGNNKHSVNR